MLSRRTLLIQAPAAAVAGSFAVRAIAADKTITIAINLPLTGADAHDADGYGTCAAWLGAMTRLAKGDAKAAVAQMRTLARHPHFAGAMAAGQISPSCVKQLDRLTTGAATLTRV